MNIDAKVYGLDNLQKYIEYVKKLVSMKTDLNFQKFIQEKVLQTAIFVTDNLLTKKITNDEYKEEYRNNHKIREEINGFVLYNDTTIPLSDLEISEKTALNYPNGFSVALAFEYGTGIVGQNSPVIGAWDYNVNDWNWAWTYSKNGQFYSTYGYEGMEIYRNIAIKCKSEMSNWVNEYFEKEVK